MCRELEGERGLDHDRARFVAGAMAEQVGKGKENEIDNERDEKEIQGEKRPQSWRKLKSTGFQIEVQWNPGGRRLEHQWGGQVVAL